MVPDDTPLPKTSRKENKSDTSKCPDMSFILKSLHKGPSKYNGNKV